MEARKSDSVCQVLGANLISPKTRLILAAVTVLVTSCATPYLPPQEGAPTAKLRFVVNTGDPTHLKRMDLSRCPLDNEWSVLANTHESWLFGDKTEVSSVKMIGTSPKPESRIRERVIDADKPFYFWISSFTTAVEGTPGYSCKVTGVFHPKRDGEYEMSWQVRRQRGDCIVEISQLTGNSSGELLRTPDRGGRSFPARSETDFCRFK